MRSETGSHRRRPPTASLTASLTALVMSALALLTGCGASARFIIVKRAAFQILLANAREAARRSGERITSRPWIASCASVKRSASVP